MLKMLFSYLPPHLTHQIKRQRKLSSNILTQMDCVFHGDIPHKLFKIFSNQSDRTADKVSSHMIIFTMQSAHK